MIAAEAKAPTGPRTAIPTRQEAIARARALAPEIAKRAPAAERLAMVPQESIDALRESGLFGVVTPKRFGGAELGFGALFDVTVEIAAACPSTGWVYGVVAGHSWLVNLFPLEAQEEVLADPNALSATLFRLAGDVVEVEGGYRLTGGSGRFASGVDHASWLIVGNAVQRKGALPDPHFFILPRPDFEIIDDWSVVGMRATGSKSVTVRDCFIPKHRAVRLSDMLAGTSPGAKAHDGPLYRLPFSSVAPFSIVGAPIGAARGGIECFAEMMKARLAGVGAEELADAGDTLARLASSAAKLDAAIALVRTSAARIDALGPSEALTATEITNIPRNWAYAVQSAREAINALFEVSGGSQVYDSSQLQRFWRDANAGAQHFAFTWGAAMKAAGRAMVGASPSAFALKSK
ncbi:MAG: acyl-CoA dehydrogenase family protein [Hyphomonadaceae bacterium]|nr:acyl-CoA dehydrogenase family protein [Hyphomonadaceae bacterium]